VKKKAFHFGFDCCTVSRRPVCLLSGCGGAATIAAFFGTIASPAGAKEASGFGATDAATGGAEELGRELR
jgi:hypothetical protein